MNKLATIVTLISALLLSTNTTANFKVETLLETTTSWDGGNFYYPSGKAKITVKKIVGSAYKNFKKLHCHVVPLAAYVIKGSVEIVKKSGQTHIFKAGDAFAEVMNQWHTGRSNKDVEIIVFYAGDAKTPLNIYTGDAKEYLCK